MPTPNPPLRPVGPIPDPPPLFPPTFGLIGSHANWRSTWRHIVAGKFSNSPYSSLLFYERGTGYAEFYDTDGQGGISFFQSHSNWPNSRLRPHWKPDCKCEFARKAHTETAFGAEQSVLCSPVCLE
jgi:hypothetical protein